MAILKSIEHMYQALAGDSILAKLGISLGAVIAGYIMPIVGLLVACFTLSTVDLFYGIKVAHKQRQKITSDKTWHGTIAKIFDEFIIILLARILEFTILGTEGVFVLTGGITAIIGLTELWSILENLNTLDPNGPWRALGKFLKKKGEDYTGITLDNNEHSDNQTGDNSSKLDKESLQNAN